MTKTAEELVELYSELIRFERKAIKESNEKIAERAYQLEKAAREVASK